MDVVEAGLLRGERLRFQLEAGRLEKKMVKQGKETRKWRRERGLLTRGILRKKRNKVGGKGSDEGYREGY